MTELEELDALAAQRAFGYHAGGGGIVAHRIRASHCAQGHEYTVENTRWYRCNGRMRRLCRACSKAQRKKHGAVTA